MKIYLDDERPTPEGWVRTYTATETINLLKAGGVAEISLDHDLGIEEDGYDVAVWIEEAAALGTLGRIKWNLHTANPSGRRRMEAALLSAERYWRKACEGRTDES